MSLSELVVTSREPLAGGATWGGAGPYEVVRGVARFDVDPREPANRRIVDLPLAVGADGLVRSEADVCVIRPCGAESARKLLFVVPNRGLLGPFPFSAGVVQPFGVVGEIDPGDGFLLRRGWTIAWCGWQWDIRRDLGGLGLDVPPAMSGGAPVTCRLRVQMRGDAPYADHALSDSGPMFTFANNPTVDLDDPDAVLTVRDSLDGPRTVIDRGQWRFARHTAAGPVPDPDRVWLEGGFRPHRFYELVYRTNRCPVAGLGLLAVRDIVSFLRSASAEAGNPCAGDIDHTFGFGISQSGRFLRQFLFEGCNVDEAGGRVFDGVLAYSAGGRRGEFNHRGAQPSETLSRGFGDLPPFASMATDSGLLERLPEGAAPKTFLVNTAWEYWRGDAALVHVDHERSVDLGDDGPVRAYLLAGVDHTGAAPLVKEQLPLANTPNLLDASLTTRALLIRLAEWVSIGVEPPPSAVPRLADGSAAERGALLDQLASIPGARLPQRDLLPCQRDIDLGPQAGEGVGRWPVVVGAPLPAWVSAIDADGNEVAGVRVPELVAPTATHTGWNPRTHIDGLPDVLYEFAGSCFPFARTPEERAATGDPRPSLAERYRDGDHYAALAGAAADDLVERGLLLDEDREAAVRRAVESYERAVA